MTRRFEQKMTKDVGQSSAIPPMSCREDFRSSLRLELTNPMKTKSTTMKHTFTVLADLSQCRWISQGTNRTNISVPSMARIQPARVATSAFEYFGPTWYQRQIAMPPDRAGDCSLVSRVTCLRVTIP